MANGVSNAEKLADIIRKERLDEIQEEYYEEVSKRVYDKWYGKGIRGGKPYLDPSKHGGFTQWEEREGFQTKTYYMLRRKYYSMRRKKIGKHYKFKPDKKMLASTYREMHDLETHTEERNVRIYKNGSTSVTIALAYKKTVPQYAHSMLVAEFLQTDAGSKYWEFYKEGKQSKIDKLILKSIGSWAQRNGITCKITMKGEDDDENT